MRNTITCQHGLPCDGTTGPEQCQRCDWCPQCEAVREFDGHTCGTCKWEWGTEPKESGGMRSKVIGIIGVLIVIASLALSTRASGTDTTPPPRTHWMRTACVQEDSTNCEWNAQVAGNGVGHSFYTVRRHLIGPHGHTLGRVICVYYVKPADARRWDACHLLPKGEDGSL